MKSKPLGDLLQPARARQVAAQPVHRSEVPRSASHLSNAETRDDSDEAKEAYGKNVACGQFRATSSQVASSEALAPIPFTALPRASVAGWANGDSRSSTHMDGREGMHALSATEAARWFGLRLPLPRPTMPQPSRPNSSGPAKWTGQTPTEKRYVLRSATSGPGGRVRPTRAPAGCCFFRWSESRAGVSTSVTRPAPSSVRPKLELVIVDGLAETGKARNDERSLPVRKRDQDRACAAVRYHRSRIAHEPDKLGIRHVVDTGRVAGRSAEGPCWTKTGSASPNASTSQRSRSKGAPFVPVVTRITTGRTRSRHSGRGGERGRAPATGRRAGRQPA